MIQITNGLLRLDVPRREVDSYLKCGWKLAENEKVSTETEMTCENVADATNGQINGSQKNNSKSKRKKSK